MQAQCSSFRLYPQSTHSPIIKVSILSNKCNTLFSNLPKTQFFSLKLQYPSIIASQFANCIIYSSGLKKGYPKVYCDWLTECEGL